MKIFILSTIVLFGIYFIQDDKLVGKYTMHFEEEFKDQNCVIYFQDSIYRRKLDNGKIVRGKIFVKNLKVFLQDKNSHFSMVFQQKKWGNDTIHFATINEKDNIKNGEFFIYPNQLIKVK